MPGPSEVEIRILEKDATSFETDVLVLKHAQALYGLDAKVVQVADIDAGELPPSDGFRVFSQPHGIAAGGLVFVGVRPIRQFSYPDIRRFGYKALCSVASAFPGAQDVALTLHGGGYGLDEFACFDAEIAGILDALDSHDYPRSLRTISLLEINPGRAARLSHQLDSLLGRVSASVTGVQQHRASHPRPDRLRTAGTDLAQTGHAFVAMPFDSTFSDVFHYGISSAVRTNGLLCERIDKQAFTGDILQRLKDQIETAKLVVADLTSGNANVFLEVGFAWGSGVPTVLVCRQGEDLRFDVQSQKCLFYGSIRDLEEKLSNEIQALLPSLRRS